MRISVWDERVDRYFLGTRLRATFKMLGFSLLFAVLLIVGLVGGRMLG